MIHSSKFANPRTDNRTINQKKANSTIVYEQRGITREQFLGLTSRRQILGLISADTNRFIVVGAVLDQLRLRIGGDDVLVDQFLHGVHIRRTERTSHAPSPGRQDHPRRQECGLFGGGEQWAATKTWVDRQRRSNAGGGSEIWGVKIQFVWEREVKAAHNSSLLKFRQKHARIRHRAHPEICPNQPINQPSKRKSAQCRSTNVAT